ncbi:MAG: AAA family ATPase [Ignavibacteriaceae bacterium]|jgi:wobble nucleotide-excising tRNase|nr:AAA family ATPase [Ignavibacteriaceae bacterium]
MIIKKISQIKSLGSYSNFEWSGSTQEFTRNNFIYGWNYSGKTTLSRLFRSLELKERHNDYPYAEFKIETDQEEITHSKIGTNYSIKVFNEEFILDNFDWNNEKHEIHPVIILGKVAKELESELESLKEKYIDLESELNDLRSNKRSKDNELQRSLTSKASEIRTILNITNPRDFDRNSLESIIKTIGPNYEKMILPNEKYQVQIDILHDSNDYEKTSYPDIKFDSTSYRTKTSEILNRKLSVKNTIEKLKSDPLLSKWVFDGLKFHQPDKTECQFCGNELPDDLLDKLQNHFSNEYSNFISEIDNYKKDLEKLKENLEQAIQELPQKNAIWRDCREQYELSLKEFQSESSLFIEGIQNLIDQLSDKKNNVFEAVSLDAHLEIDKSVKRKYTVVKKILRDHNRKLDNLLKESEIIEERVKFHNAASFVIDSRYYTFLRLDKIYESLIAIRSTKLGTIQTRMEEIKRQIKAEAIGADRINEYLIRFFNNDRLAIKLMENGRYKLYRNETLAKNLSTGEKNIISLIYFFVRLEEDNFNLSESIIFLDDPVSSLDSNHIFGVYGFLSERLKNCGQLFITTHNFDFFNLLKDLKFYFEDEETHQQRLIKPGLFLIKNINENSKIENLPSLLNNYKSEYNYLFKLLYSFNDDADKSSNENLFILPNIARRFLEAYLFMKYPNGKDFKEKCKNLFCDCSETERLKTLKLLDEYSHERNPEHSRKFPDIQELESGVKLILATISGKDNEHFNALVESLRN